MEKMVGSCECDNETDFHCQASFPGRTELPGVKLARSNHSLEILTKNKNYRMNL